MSSTITTITLFSIVFSIFPSPSSTTALNFLPPYLSPRTGDVCKEVECGMGKCKMSGQNDLAYECECDAGWKQSLSLFSNASALNFLPCVIPNCTLNSSCSEASAPEAAQENTSIFEPCNWANCGGGVCEKKSDLLFTCKCKDGFINLLNNSAFPCISQCTLNRTCSEAEAPAPNLFPANVSILEPCEWMNCGGGECKKKSGLSYSCECRNGYANLLNSTAYPCFKQCSFGGDCSVPGFNVQSQTSAASPQNAMASTSLGNVLQPELVLNAIIILAMSVAVVGL